MRQSNQVSLNPTWITERHTIVAVILLFFCYFCIDVVCSFVSDGLLVRHPFLPAAHGGERRNKKSTYRMVNDDPSLHTVEDDRTDSQGDIDDDSLEASTLRSVTFCNLPKDQEPDVLCDFLLEIGACSASVVDADRGTEWEQPIFDEPTNEPKPIISPVWNKCNVTAHFPASTDLNFVMEMISDTLAISKPALQNYRIEQVPNKDWVIHVQQGWKPIIVADKFVLRFPWHDDDDVIEKIRFENTSKKLIKDDMIQIRLQGGVAFGTGEHQTTQLCLEWLNNVLLSEMADNIDKPITVLDYGSGSGILGMGACALVKQFNSQSNRHHHITAVGIDIDIDACRIANVNSKINNITMCNYLPPLRETDDGESKSLLMKAQMKAMKESQNNEVQQESILLPEHLQDFQYDICVANILAGPLVSLASSLAGFVKPGGRLGLSGILPHQGEMIVDAYTSAGFENVKVSKELGGWILVTGSKQLITS